MTVPAVRQVVAAA